MRIIHFLGGRRGPGTANGVANAVSHLSKHQAQAGHKVSVLCLGPEALLETGDIEVRVFPPSLGPFSLPQSLMESIEELAPDLIHLHSVFTLQNVVLAHWLRSKRIPYVVTPHGGLSPVGLEGRRKYLKMAFKHLLERSYWRGAAFVHAVSIEEANYLCLYGLGVPVVVAPNGVDSRQIPSLATLDHSYLVNRFPQTQGKTVFLFLGRLDPVQKGLDLLLEAYARRRESLSRAVLVVAGPDSRGGLRRLERSVRNYGLGQQVIFAGPRYGRERFDVLAACDVFVYPSRSEGMPLAVLEALAVQKPCLITSPVGFGDFFEKYRVGLRVEPSVEAIAGAIEHLSLLPKDELGRMGAQAREAVLREFSWAATAAKVCGAYEELASRREQAVSQEDTERRVGPARRGGETASGSARNC